MKRLLLVTTLTLALLLVFTSVVWADNGDNNDGVNTGGIALLLAPLVAAATVVERIIEMLFNWYESIILNASSLLGEVRDYLSWTRKQVNKYREAVWNAKTPDALKTAESQLAEAEKRLQKFLKSPFYISRKRAITLLLGILFGLIIAFTARLKMFSLLGIVLAEGTVNQNVIRFLAGVDMFITGLIIGTGSAPVHSLIGILQKTKDAVDQARGLWKGKALHEIQDILTGLQGQYESTVPERGSMSEVDIERLAERLLD